MEIIRFIIYASIYLGIIATTFFILTYISDKKREKQLFKDSELPKISVLIPAFNEESSIKETIKSILASNYPKDKFEVIFINDGSTDKTLEKAKEIKHKNLKILSKPNGGKATALNLGIKKATGEIVFTMDADTNVPKHSMKQMVRYFKDPEVMSVTPGMLIEKPKSILQRVQHIEYLTGIFLRKTFSILNAVHITPGAFSAYRKSFFDKYGGYEEDNITEDLEIALRIQYKGYKIENSPESQAYTIAPAKFVELLKQRRRWYTGLIKNMWRYKKLFGKEYGDLGMFILPVAWMGIAFALTIAIYYFFHSIVKIHEEILFYRSVNYDFGNIIDMNMYFLERLFFKLASNPTFLFVFLFIFIIAGYLIYASKKTGKISNLAINLPLFFVLFSILFSFWWMISIVYVVFNKTISWK